MPAGRAGGADAAGSRTRSAHALVAARRTDCASASGAVPSAVRRPSSASLYGADSGVFQVRSPDRASRDAALGDAEILRRCSIGTRACLPRLRVLPRDCGVMSREQILTDEQWARMEPLLPSSKGKQSRPFRDHRQVLEGIAYRYRVGCAWRDVPKTYGPWQTLWKRHARFSRDGTWDRIHAQLLAEADAAQLIDWQLSIDSTISRVHQHGATLSRETVLNLPSHTGGPGELQETAGRAG